MRCASPVKPAKSRASAAFSLVELLLVLMIISTILGMGIPKLLETLNRAKLTTVAQQTAALMQAARLEAIKRSANRPTPGAIPPPPLPQNVMRVEAQFPTATSAGLVLAYLDVDGDGVYTQGTDVLLGKVTLPSGVALGGPGPDPATQQTNAVSGLTLLTSGSSTSGGVAFFLSDGSVYRVGAIRFRDRRSNVIEVFVSPLASARIAVRKFAGDPDGKDDLNQYFESAQGMGPSYENAQSGTGLGWKWNWDSKAKQWY
jgi:Tfp pilus assembly protein FimT